MKAIKKQRLSELTVLADSTAPKVSIYASDLRALLAERTAVLDARAKDLPSPAVGDLHIDAANATASSSMVKIRPVDLATLLDLHGELVGHQLRERAQEREAAKADSEGREILVRDGATRRPVLVSPEHGANRPSVRAYAFDTEHLAGFLGLHPETVRKAIRAGDLVPTDLGSIHAYKLRVDEIRRRKERES